jgi:uncharacterized HhH-GPD family protein
VDGDDEVVDPDQHAQQGTPTTPRTMTTMPSRTPASLPYTGNAEADALLAADPLALLIGFILDQQITTIKAFSGPLELRRRTGSLDPAALAAMDPADLDAVFRRTPALHRFPGTMATRVRAACAIVAEQHGGDASRIWTDAASVQEVRTRLMAIPGIGTEKAADIIGVLANSFDTRPAGWEQAMPAEPSLAYVDSPETMARYLGFKRAAKAVAREAGTTP